MVIVGFPPVELADEYGLLAVGGDLDPESLLLAYRSGVFPWPMLDEGDPITWFAPPQRSIILFDKFREPRSLKKERRRTSFTFAIDTNFAAVIAECRHSSKRTGQAGTWITSEVERAYLELHRAGYAHSIECYDGVRLVGGLYGVSIGGMFAGESMFYHEPNASKMCVAHLFDHLRARGATWFDCQQQTALFESFGAEEIAREDFQDLLQVALERPALFP